ncbi:MBL fold metallo-hydrolase [Pseudonocardia nigra]|uniref:MBL fold metallo-hydrolase n=1 Tax=Pseudonocardia nigra TaxID=1921578 RepID=UPI001FE40C21|nr:MBL fold metallo-hydrolase [Pseudonocardia nigra]
MPELPHEAKRRSPTMPRRSLLQAGAVGIGALTAASAMPAVASASVARAPTGQQTSRRADRCRTRLVLLGTAAGPSPRMGRLGMASALVVGDRAYLVDAGRGMVDQVARAEIPFGSISDVLVTHLHSDHVAELFNLFLLTWGNENPNRSTISRPVGVWGPGPAGALPPARDGRPAVTVEPQTPGLVEYFERSLQANAYDVNVRVRDTGRPDIRSVYQLHELALPAGAGPGHDDLAPEMQPFLVFEDDRVRVHATLVHHPPMFPCYAFRFDTEDGSVVFSGDTTASSNLVRLARAADVLVHEVIETSYYEAQNWPPGRLAHLRESFTDVSEVGAVAAAADVRTLVLSHLAPGDPEAVPDSTWHRKASQGFDGQVIVGHDLLQIGVGAPG